MKNQIPRARSRHAMIESLENRTLLSAGTNEVMHPDAAGPVTHTTLHVSRRSLKLGQTDVFTATVTAARKLGAIAGTVEFLDNGTAIQTTDGTLSVTLGANDRASYTFACGNVALYVGRQIFNAEFISTNSLPSSSSHNTIVNVTVPFLHTAKDGLETATVIAGHGKKIKAGQTATVVYTGFLAASGTIFDYATADHGTDTTPDFSFTVEASPEQVITGFDEGVLGMQVGQTRVLAIPYKLGYGSEGSGSIPPNADLVFLVKLESIS